MPKPKDKHDEQHLKNVQLYLKRIQELYKIASDEASKIGCSINGVDSSKPFNFDDYPQTKKKMDKLLSKFKKSLEVSIVNGIDAEWALSNSKNDEIVNKAFGSKKDKLTDEQKKRYFNNNEDAKDAFIERKRNGLSLSDSVWDFTKRFKSEIEMGLDLGIRSGKSADQMSRSLRDYLQNTNKLFRRYKDEHGILQLSKAAKAFHPGQGVYRSSYMNARRLAATETNIAYRTADHLRWKEMDFVVGIEIHLSNNHTCKGRDGKPHDFHDICDELQGKYPKDFKFTGWHPHCRCFVTSILKTPDELKSGKPSKNEVKELPSKFKEWYENNKERIDRAKSLPYFIKDNFKDGEFIGLQSAIASPTIEIDTNVTGSFIPAKSIEEAVGRAMNLGIERVDFGRATLGEVNIVLEAIEEEARNVKLELKSFFIQENAHKDIFGKRAKETQKIGGYYSHNKNELHIDLGIFKESIYKKAISWEERLKRNENKIKSNLDSIALYKSKLGKSKAFDRELKKFISDLDFQIYKFEKEVRLANERIQAGAPPRTFTYAEKYENIKDQVKATIHHEFGHYVDNKMGGARFNSKLPGISDYSDTMSDEFFAEYYAKYRMEGKAGIPSDILKVLEEYEAKFAKEVQKPLTTLEKAKIRQEARTKKQIADIQKRWDERKKSQSIILKTEYKTLQDVDETFKEINSKLTEKWFTNGDLKLSDTNKKGVNGFTYKDGRISLTKERNVLVRSALGKIGRRKEEDITFEEADAMAVLWHEITHNRNVCGFPALNTTQTAVMELMNEFVARKTLPEFYKVLGCKNTPHEVFMNYRKSTGYNSRVLAYDYVIETLKLDTEKVLESAKNNLFNLKYTEQDIAAKQALLDGGLNKLKLTGNKLISETQLAKLVDLCRLGVSPDTLHRYLKSEGIISD